MDVVVKGIKPLRKGTSMLDLKKIKNKNKNIVNKIPHMLCMV
jgi:hypothetical protein